MTKEELLQAISDMTVLELADLVKALEERFGVSAAAPPVGVVPDIDESPASNEATEFDVMLISVGDQKIQVIKVVRELTSLGLRESKAVVDQAPSEVLKNVSKEVAAAAKDKLTSVGADVRLWNSDRKLVRAFAAI